MSIEIGKEMRYSRKLWQLIHTLYNPSIELTAPVNTVAKDFQGFENQNTASICFFSNVTSAPPTTQPLQRCKIEQSQKKENVRDLSCCKPFKPRWRLKNWR